MLHLLFIIIVVITLAATFLDNITLEFAVKPLIMIWIASYFIVNRNRKDFTVPVLLAFFFSWTGDVLLMFSERNEVFFYAGAGGFFLAQLSYIFVFYRYYEFNVTGLIHKKPALVFIFFAYLAFIYGFLSPYLDGIMKFVILIYAASIIIMSIFALNRNGRVQYRSYLPVFLGSLCFVISDSLLAINMFHTMLPISGFLIMLTYISAQYLIMRGLVIQKPVQTQSKNTRGLQSK